jgi:hypothetical protein
MTNEFSYILRRERDVPTWRFGALFLISAQQFKK